MSKHFRSLRTRLLVPLAVCSLAVAIVIGIVSYRLGDRAVRAEMDQRFDVIHRTLREARFPLTNQVLRTLADLAGVELATYGPSGDRLQSTVAGAPAVLPSVGWPEWSTRRVPLYRSRAFLRRAGTSNREAERVLVMFADADTGRERFGAAALPLITGLSSTLLLSLVAWILTERMIARIARLEQNVNRVAAGDFASASAPTDVDELGRLENAVRRMGSELRSLWTAVHRQERQRLIHQMAAGLAHQLRNALTGARMAIELHEQGERTTSSEGLRVAKREIRRTEDYVQRILSIAAEPDRSPAAGRIGPAIEPVQENLRILANHHRVALIWEMDRAVAAASVADVSSLSSALENLVINAMQSGGDTVRLEAHLEGAQVHFRVVDNGPGPPAPSAPGDADLFDPFVTSKPEGLGLGLTLVRRAAENLGGGASWTRENGTTIFLFSASILFTDGPLAGSRDS